MNRLWTGLRWETTIQFRQGIYYAAAFVAFVWSALLYGVPDAGIEPLLVSVLFIDLAVFGFFFMAAIYYLEKGDRVIEGLVVTPLRTWEYLMAKIITLTITSIVVGAIVTLVVYGVVLNWFWYVVAVVVMSLPVTLLGFVIAARYNGINEFLIPGSFYLAILQIPLLAYFGVVDTPLLYLLPSGPGLIFLEMAFGSVPAWLAVFALAYTVVLTVASFRWARRTFDQVVAQQIGTA